MKIEDTTMYPEYKKKVVDIVLYRKIVMISFFIVACISLLINIIIGGKFWFLYVVGGELVFWFVFMSDAMVESGALRRIVRATVVISLFLFLVDYMAENHGWAVNIVIPVLCFTSAIVLSILFFIQFKRGLTNILYFYFYITLGSFSILLGLFGIVKLTWPWIVLASCSLFALILTVILYRGQIFHEFKKKFSMR